MDKKQAQEALSLIKSGTPRKFKQSIDLIMTFKGLDLKKPDHQVDNFISLHYNRGKKVKVCGLVGPELIESAKENFDFAILADDFEKYQKDKKAIKKLASDYDFFVAQGNIMAKVATVFGRVFGPKQKMPNPKGGCVVPPNANLSQVYDRLQKMVRVTAKTQPMIQCAVGLESMKEEELVDNIMTVHNSILHSLPQEANNIRSVVLKLTMGKPVRVGEKESAQAETTDDDKQSPSKKKASSKEEKAPVEEAPQAEKKAADAEPVQEKETTEVSE